MFLSIVYLGCGAPFFAPAVFEYLVHDSYTLADEDEIPDFSLRLFIDKVSFCLLFVLF